MAEAATNPASSGLAEIATTAPMSMTFHAQTGGHEASHDAEAPEVPSGLDLLATMDFAQRQYHPFDLTAISPKTGRTVIVPVRFTIAEAIHSYQNQFFALMLVAVVAAVLGRRLRRASLRQPGRFQMLVEMFVQAFRNLVCGVLGEKNGRRYLPYIGSLFLFIFLSNLMGLVPFLRSPTSVYQTTFALGVCTFLYVQFTAVTRNGLLRYLYHMAGEPRGESLGMAIFMWVMGIVLLLPLHLLGELIKPISLSLRLFGNILGEDILLGVFAMLGLSLMGLFGWKEPWIGLPLQLPFFFLAMLTATIQALVFALLSMVYFMMVLPHDEHEGKEHQEKMA
jgi:F-type H+-transporting ATPase subunit a